MESRPPRISVILPVYNASRYLTSALESVQKQRFSDFEIIAINDGSSDDSQSLLDAVAMREPRLRVLSRPNTGIVGALNDGLAAARGEFIARMDADDVATPERFASQVAYLDAHPECVGLGTDILFTDPEGAPLVRLMPALAHEKIVENLLNGNGGALIHPTIMMRREAVMAAGGYRLAYQWVEDLDLYLRLSRLGKLANLPEVHLHYRQHTHSVNHKQGAREALRRELVNDSRADLGLPPVGEMAAAIDPPGGGGRWRRHWAYEAARGFHMASARKNAWLAVLQAPFLRANLRCLRYVLTVSRQRMRSKS